MCSRRRIRFRCGESHGGCGAPPADRAPARAQRSGSCGKRRRRCGDRAKAALAGFGDVPHRATTKEPPFESSSFRLRSKKAGYLWYPAFFDGSRRRIRTLTNRVRVCRATFTQFGCIRLMGDYKTYYIQSYGKCQCSFS